ncbi:MAG: hypothetical protein ACH36H_12495 [Candidatus Nanopelagicales bacterium]
MTITSTDDFADLAAHVDALRDRVRHQERSAAELLDETLEAITEFNRRGLIALVHTLRQDPRGEELLFLAVDQPEVMALLASHGIIRTESTLDVLRVVEAIRPYLVTSSIEMDVERVSGDVAYVRFGSGCSAPSQEAKDEIRGVILQRVPGLRAVEEVVEEPGQTFISVASLRVGPA